MVVTMHSGCLYSCPKKKNWAKRLSAEPGLILLCGRYEGIDERVLDDAATHHRVTPVSIGGQLLSVLLPEYAVLVLVLTQAIALIIQNAFVAPFTAAVTSLQYLDQRMRKEAYDVELMARAGLTAP